MTPEQFNNLDEMEQAETVWDGKHIGDRQDDEYSILLYKNEDLYIEVYVHKTNGVIKKIMPLSKDEILDIYTFKIGFSIN